MSCAQLSFFYFENMLLYRRCKKDIQLIKLNNLANKMLLRCFIFFFVFCLERKSCNILFLQEFFIFSYKFIFHCKNVIYASLFIHMKDLFPCLMEKKRKKRLLKRIFFFYDGFIFKVSPSFILLISVFIVAFVVLS